MEDSREQVVLMFDNIENPSASLETVRVTLTATMGHGSLLKADGTEAAAAEAALAVGAIDAPLIDQNHEAGDIVAVPVVKRNAILRKESLKFSDAALAAEALPLMDDAALRRQSAVTDFSRTY